MKCHLWNEFDFFSQFTFTWFGSKNWMLLFFSHAVLCTWIEFLERQYCQYFCDLMYILILASVLNLSYINWKKFHLTKKKTIFQYRIFFNDVSFFIYLSYESVTQHTWLVWLKYKYSIKSVTYNRDRLLYYKNRCYSSEIWVYMP